MDALGWAETIAGAAVVVGGLLDAFLTVFHPDHDGPVTTAFQRTAWRRVAVPWARARGARGRRILASAGPVLLLVTVLAWAGALVVGGALLADPHLAGGFDEALYFAGTSATTLGYGATSTGWLRAIEVALGACGFALIPTVLAYFMGVLNGVGERNVATLMVREDTDATGDGVRLVVRAAGREGVDALRERLGALADATRLLHERHGRFPVLALYYRSADPALAPEPAVRATVEAAVAALALAESPDHARLRPAALRLDSALSHFMTTLGDHYLPREAAAGVREPVVGDEDRAVVARVRARIETGIGASAGEPRAAVVLAARARAFFEGLEALTGWRTVEGGARPLAAESSGGP